MRLAIDGDACFSLGKGISARMTASASDRTPM